jgi:5,10-methylenetetrahydromethanopterin reductase
MLPVAALREAIDVIRRMLRGEEVTQSGKVISLTQGRLQFAPPRAQVPVYIATQGSQRRYAGGRRLNSVD